MDVRREGRAKPNVSQTRRTSLLWLRLCRITLLNVMGSHVDACCDVVSEELGGNVASIRRVLQNFKLFTAADALEIQGKQRVIAKPQRGSSL